MTAVAKRQSMSTFLSNDKTSKFLEEQLREKKGEFVSNLIAITESNADLANCEPSKLMKCAMNATALNLPLNKNLGYAYVIPYKHKGNAEPQFQIGYKGFIQLAIRTGQYKTINSCEVREGEIKRNKFTGEIKFIGEYPDNKIIGYLGYIELLNGFVQSVYMTVEQINAHAKKYSANFRKYGTGLWADDTDAMSKKTVLKLLLNRYGVLSTEMAEAIRTDQSFEDGSYKDNPNSIRDVEAEEVIDQSDPLSEAPETPAKEAKEAKATKKLTDI